MPCPCQCFARLKVTCCHFIQSLAYGQQTLFSALVSPAKNIVEKFLLPTGYLVLCCCFKAMLLVGILP